MRHHAFLSYNHGADATLAAAFQRGLERIAKPLLKLRAMNVFRDATDLTASPALWPGIVAHLEEAEWLLVFACPAWAASMWCNKEVQWWLTHRSTERLLIVLTGGEIVWDRAAGDFDWSRTTALPTLLAKQLADEPLFVDLRWAASEPGLSLRDLRFRDAVVNVAAPLRGVRKDELDSADQRQLARNRLLVRGGVAAIVAAAGIAIWQAIDASRQRDEALRQRDLALARQLAAQADLLRVQQPDRLPLALLMATQAARSQPDALETQLTLQATLALFARPLVRLPHAAGVVAIEFSPDGQGVATAAADGQGGLWQIADGRRAAVFEGADRQAVFAPDGARVATCCKRVAVWRADGTRLWSFDDGPGDGTAQAVAFSPDGRWLAVGRAVPQGFDLFDAATGTRVHSRRFDVAGYTTGTLFLPSGELVVPHREFIHVYTLPDDPAGPWPEPRVLDPALPTVHELAASRDGRWLAASSTDRVNVIELAKGSIAARLQARGDGPGRLHALRFDAGGAHLGAVGELNVAAVWRTGEWREVAAPRHGTMQTVHSIAFDPAREVALTCASDGRCVGWSLTDGQRVLQLAHRHAHTGAEASARVMHAGRYAPQGGLLASAGHDGAARLWDLSPPGEVARSSCPAGEPLARTGMPANRRWDGEAGQDLELPAPRCAPLRPQGLNHTFRLVADPTGGIVAAGLPSDAVEVWAAAASAPLAQLRHDEPVDWSVAPAHLKRRGVLGRFQDQALTRMRAEGSLQALAVSASGARLATLREADNRLRLWDTRSGTVLLAEVLPADPPLIEFLSDTRMLRLDAGTTLSAWSLPDAKVVWSVAPPASAPLSALAVSSDGRRVVTAGPRDAGARDGASALRVIDTSGGERVLDAAVDVAVRVVGFDRSGQHVFGLTGAPAVVPFDELPPGVGVRLWNLAARKETITLAPSERIVALDVSADARRFAAVGRGGELRVWDLVDGSQRRTVVTDPGPLAFSADGRWLAVGRRSVRVFDAATLEAAGQIELPFHAREIAFSADAGAIVASGLGTGNRAETRARRWRSPDLLIEACRRLPRDDAEAQWRQLFPSQPVPAPC